jgi:hypothetical protein
VQGDEILRIIRRITRDFAPILPGLRLELISPEGFRARVRGKPIIADQAMLRAVLGEEAGGAGGRGGRPWGRAALGSAAKGEGPERSEETAKGKGHLNEPYPEAGPAFAVSGGKVPEVKKPIPPGRGSPEGEERKGEKVREEKTREGPAERYPLYALPSSRTILVEMESLAERVNQEDRRLHRPLVEGLVLREVLYLITSGQPLPEPRARAERILRRHWPFQYAALRSVGLTVTGFERPPQGEALGRDN